MGPICQRRLALFCHGPHRERGLFLHVDIHRVFSGKHIWLCPYGFLNPQTKTGGYACHPETGRGRITVIGILVLPFEHINRLMGNAADLQDHIAHSLYATTEDPDPQLNGTAAARPSAVLFLIGYPYDKGTYASEPNLILNKRSSAVRQAGDLCCPGGGVSFTRDANLSRLLSLPGSPLKRWPFWEKYAVGDKAGICDLKVLLTASLRESYEEMRLNPLKVRFLGLLPTQRLGAYHRAIYPMMGWASRQKRFCLNWEVDKIVSIPLRQLLNPANYALMQFDSDAVAGGSLHHDGSDHPCYIHKASDTLEILWGATYRITMSFLRIAFGFTPPCPESLPRVTGALSRNYDTGTGREQ